ncbi:hypothetical protein FKW77_000836 [Venturia effusa]|uniref:Mediator of RNA polymerase II transcription subunit 6 n=1 Tax=Venturia effusa TaxID=50376 RepID=A0A517LM60_9PEZI|nr:hypothetical protein FKW77_000836 [Venturia effusa]
MSASLENTVWSDPALIEFLNSWYVRAGFLPGVTAESVHAYFLNSPFVDDLSNNALLRQQAASGNGEWMFDRKAMDAKLDVMQGIEYRIVEGPETSYGLAQLGNPVWVVRKQFRERKQSEARGTYFRVTRVEGTYFIMGELVYMAPSLEDVLRIRLMAATRAMQKFYKAAHELYFFSPDRGYSYHSTAKSSKSKALLESTRTSRANSPILDTASQSSAQPSASNVKGEIQSQPSDDRAIANSFQLAVRWGNEYMDENPLIGEPGALKLSSTSRQLKDHQEKIQATEASKAAQKLKEKEAESARASVVATPTPAPPAIKTSDLKKGSISKGKSPTSAVSDGGVKKARRKSTKPGTPGVTSPTS